MKKFILTLLMAAFVLAQTANVFANCCTYQDSWGNNFCGSCTDQNVIIQYIEDAKPAVAPERSPEEELDEELRRYPGGEMG